MNRTLIIGHTGQDGRILWKQLEERGHVLIGISRSEIRYHAVNSSYDVTPEDPVAICLIVGQFRPHYIYYLAAFHQSSQGPHIDLEEVCYRSWRTHVDIFKGVLESIRKQSPETRIFYASTSRIFGSSDQALLNEDTQWGPTCIYGITKAAGMIIAKHYREVHNLHVSCGILFNHESSIRGGQFVSQRIIEGLVAVKYGRSNKIELGNVDAKVDWGFAPDYTRAMSLMLNLDHPGDFVIATGKTHTVRQMAELAAKLLELNLREFLVENNSILTRKSQGLRGDPARLIAKTGWAPSVSFEQMVKIMVDAAIQRVLRSV